MHTPHPEHEPRTSRRLSIPSEIGLVLVCQATVLFGAVGELGCLSGGEPTASLVCVSGSAVAPWYERSLGAAAVIAVIGVGVAHFKGSRRIAWLAVMLSLAISVVTMIWGLRQVHLY